MPQRKVQVGLARARTSGGYSEKSKVNKAFREVVANYETEAAEEIERANRPQNEIPVFEYMSVWLEKAAKDLQINTYNSYHSMIYGKILRTS